jgi:hypothetical protein
VQWHDPVMFALQQQACCSSAIFTNNLPQFPPFGTVFGWEVGTFYFLA